MLTDYCWTSYYNDSLKRYKPLQKITKYRYLYKDIDEGSIKGAIMQHNLKHPDQFCCTGFSDIIHKPKNFSIIYYSRYEIPRLKDYTVAYDTERSDDF